MGVNMALSGPITGAMAECCAGHAAARGFRLDISQQAAVRHLQRLYDALAENAAQEKRPLHRLLGGKKLLRGLYLWGGVGRGKSFLMDALYACVPVEKKRRIHFHRFMQEVHAELDTIKHHADPLVIVAERIAQQARLICFDEFHVSDIADAMLLGRLLRGLLDRGVVLVATSNHKPDDLYMHGLQRSHFLPAIALLKEKLDVVEIDSGTDYRLRALERVQTYHFPLGEIAEGKLLAAFSSLTGGEGERNVSLEIEGRHIEAEHAAPGVAWFCFQTICGGPRGQADYIEIARRFHTVLISGIPQMGSETPAECRRFIWLVDEFYDRRVKLIVSAQATPTELCRAGLNAAEFARTASRLTEMQTKQYLAQAHLP